jgi:hypothetical protein
MNFANSGISRSGTKKSVLRSKSGMSAFGLCGQHLPFDSLRRATSAIQHVFQRFTHDQNAISRRSELFGCIKYSVISRCRNAVRADI